MSVTERDIDYLQNQLERNGEHFCRGQHGAFISVVPISSGYEINAWRNGSQLSETRRNIRETTELFFDWKQKY